MDAIVLIRLSLFLFVLAAMLAWEATAPLRPRNGPLWLRRLHNLALLACSNLLLRLLPALTAVSAAHWADERGWGLFNAAGPPAGVAAVASFMLLDLIVYIQHVGFHKSSLLWRLHRVHHSDDEFDTTTGARFHPLEMFISMCIKSAAVVLIGAPVIAVVAFEIVLNATSMFNHGNVRIPARLERNLRMLLVTPDMHRVHHSVLREEHDRNFGFNFSFWDRLFDTYLARPREDPAGMPIGLSDFRERRWSNSAWLLAQPFLPLHRQV